MSDFLSDISCQSLTAKAIEKNHHVSVFTPMVKLLYDKPVQSNEELALMSLKTVILTLRVLSGTHSQKRRCLREKFGDFIVCATFYLPLELKEEAEELVKELGCHHRPPNLLNIALAKVAKVHYGLEPVTEKSVSEIVVDLTNCKNNLV